MSDRVLLPIQGVGLLALDREAFEAAIAAGREYCEQQPITQSMPDKRLLDSEHMAARLGVAKSWLEAKARRRDVPVVQIGKYRRFDPDEVIAALRRDGRP